jgi:hypothetical protein
MRRGALYFMIWVMEAINIWLWKGLTTMGIQTDTKLGTLSRCSRFVDICEMTSQNR